MAPKPDVLTPGDQPDQADPEDLKDKGADEQAEGDQQGQAAPQVSAKAANVFQRLFMAAKKMMLQKEVTPRLMQMVQSAGPVDGVVRATMVILDQLANQAQGVNKLAIYSEVLATHVALQVAALAVKAGLMEDSLKKYGPSITAALKQELGKRQGGQGQPATPPGAGAPPPPDAGQPPVAAQPSGLLSSQGA